MYRLTPIQLQELLEEYDSEHVYNLPIFYTKPSDARDCGGKWLPGMMVSSGITYIFKQEISVLWVEGWVSGFGRFPNGWECENTHANVVVVDRPKKKVLVFEPTLSILCPNVKRIGNLMGGGTERLLIRKLRMRLKGLQFSVTFGQQTNAPDCREQCLIFLDRLHSVNYDIEEFKQRLLKP